MKQQAKRWLSVLLMLTMVLGMLPGTALAWDGPHSHDSITFTPWNNNTSLPDVNTATQTDIYLTTDVTIGSTWEIPANVTVNLCLNGHGIKYNSTSNGSVIRVYSGATLNLYDCGTTTEHKYTVDPNGLATVNETGTETFTGGYITGGNGYDGGGVYVNSNGTFNMYGGTIIGNRTTSGYDGGGVYVNSNGIFNMYGGTISGNTPSIDDDGGGVYVNSNGTFNMYGGTITGNVATYGRGGGVYNFGTFKMEGGRISGNTAMHGGVANYGTFTMSGGTIGGDNEPDANKASFHGGGVYVGSGTFKMEGGTISGNTATIEDGGGVCIDRSGTFKMEGGSISGNTASSHGGGVYNQYGTFEMSGGTISGNAASVGVVEIGSGGGVCNYYGTFNLSGGTIRDNQAVYGGGVYNQHGTFEMSGGTISVNAADADVDVVDVRVGVVGGGGGVFNDGTFNLSGGTIRDNQAVYGGGVCNFDGTFNLSGNPTITGNKNGTNTDNVLLASGKKITVDDVLTSGAEIGVTMEKHGTFTSGWKDKMSSADPYDYFTSDNETYGVSLSTEGEAQLAADTPISTVATITDIPAHTYTGEAIEPDVVVKRGNTVLTKDTDYTVSYSNNTNAGTGTVTVMGKGIYKDTLTKNFTINKADSDTPTGLTATEGQTLAGVSLPDGWSWVNNTLSVGSAGTNTFKANYAGDDNHNAKQGVDVTVTVSKAPTSTPAPSGGTYIPASTTVTIPVSGEGDNAETVNVTVQISGTTATITSANVDKVLEAKDVGNVTVDVSSLNSTVDEVVLPAELVKKVADAVADTSNNVSGLEIILANGAVTFDVKALATITEQAGGKEVHLNLDTVKVDSLTSAQQETVKDMTDAKVVDVSVTADGKPISGFNGGTATIGVPYTLKDGQVAKGVVAWYLADDGTKQAVPCTYDGKNANVGAPHFSRYVIAYDQAKAAEPDPEPQPEPDPEPTPGPATPTDFGYDSLTDAQKKNADAVVTALNVDKETASQMVKVAEELGVSMDTVKLSGAALTKMNVDSSDPKGTDFGKLTARITKRINSALTLKWAEQKNADGYLIYGNKCGKGNKMKLVKAIKKKGNVSFTQKKLKKGAYYKYIVVAYKDVNGQQMPIAASVVIHVPTKGGKSTVAKSVKVDKNKVSVKKGKSVTVKANEVLEEAKLKLKTHRAVKFESSDPKIATVNAKGKITGKKKGKATIYAYAQNGVFKAIKVTVK